MAIGLRQPTRAIVEYVILALLFTGSLLLILHKTDAAIAAYYLALIAFGCAVSINAGESS